MWRTWWDQAPYTVEYRDVPGVPWPDGTRGPTTRCVQGVDIDGKIFFRAVGILAPIGSATMCARLEEYIDREMVKARGEEPKWRRGRHNKDELYALIEAHFHHQQEVVSAAFETRMAPDDDPGRAIWYAPNGCTSRHLDGPANQGGAKSSLRISGFLWREKGERYPAINIDYFEDNIWSYSMLRDAFIADGKHQAGANSTTPSWSLMIHKANQTDAALDSFDNLRCMITSSLVGGFLDVAWKTCNRSAMRTMEEISLLPAASFVPGAGDFGGACGSRESRGYDPIGPLGSLESRGYEPPRRNTPVSMQLPHAMPPMPIPFTKICKCMFCGKEKLKGKPCGSCKM